MVSAAHDMHFLRMCVYVGMCTHVHALKVLLQDMWAQSPDATTPDAPTAQRMAPKARPCSVTQFHVQIAE